MKIILETIPHKSQAYETVGNYWTDEDGTMHITVSDMGNDDYSFLVGLHELVEAWLCKKRGISDQSITDFDVAFEEMRKDSGTTLEPGDSPHAPYQNEHCFATSVERMMCAALGIAWLDYECAVEGLSQ